MEEEFRCENCKKLLFKYGAGIIVFIEVKCERCGHINILRQKRDNPNEIRA